LNPVALVVGAGGTVLAILLLIWWFLCCWTCCPCCKCCRVCRKPRKTAWKWKAVLIAIGIGIMIGIIVSAAMAFNGYNTAVDGIDNMACTVAQLLNGTLSGQENPSFLGMIPLLKLFSSMEQSLSPTAGFMLGIRAQIDSTAVISESVMVASETFGLLKVALDNMPPEIASNKHKCEFCQVLSPALATSIDVLDNGVGAALAGARKEIDKQLSPEMSSDLQGALRQAAMPLAEVKELIRDTFSFFTDTDKFLQLRGHLAGDGPKTVMWICSIIIIIALALSACMMFDLTWFCLWEERKVSAESLDTKYSKVTHRCACCTWCCGWYFAILAFLVGGLLAVVSNVLSSVCLIMDDMDLPMLEDMGGSFGLDFKQPETQQMGDILDQCVFPANRTANPALLDVITIKENGTKVTMREKIIGKVKDQIDSAFDNIDKSLQSTGGMSVKETPAVQELVSNLSNPLDMMILTDSGHDWQSDPSYSPLFAEPALRDGFISSVRCSDGSPNFGGQTIKGVEQFVAAVAALGTRASVRPDCADLTVCDVSKTPPQVAACGAGNEYVKLKQKILDLGTFRCDVFTNPTDDFSDCDPLSLTGTYDAASKKTVYSSTCVYPDGKVKRKQKNCNLNEFVTYVSQFATRINNTLGRVDKVVEETGPGISVGLKKLVTQYLLDPMNVIVNGVTCGFIGATYRKMVDGLCYQSVVGFTNISRSYNACGALALFLIVLMYGVWRRTIDNVNSRMEVKPENDGVVIP